MKIKKWAPLILFTPFLLTIFVPALVLAIPLGDLIDSGGSIMNEDKKFSDFETTRPQIDVGARLFANGNAGLSFFSTPDFGPDDSAATVISFTVTALDPNFRITELFQAVPELPEGVGTIRITDTAFALDSGDVLGSGSIMTTGLPVSETLPIVNSYALSTPVQALQFVRIVELNGPLSSEQGGFRNNMSVTQTFIPEPSTVLLFGTGLAGLGIWRWKKSRVESRTKTE